jgi:hypothetical protein
VVNTVLKAFGAPRERWLYALGTRDTAKTIDSLLQG